MTDIIIVKVHSLVDMITNSSNEIFVCKSDKTVDEVKEILYAVLLAYNAATDKELNFEDVFGNIYIYENIEKEDDYYDFTANEGDLIIESAEDNSIPYGMFELIEDMFDATRHHI